MIQISKGSMEGPGVTIATEQDARAWVPSSSGVFSVKSFFLALTNLSDSVPFYPTKFLWKSRVPSKVMAFTWLVALMKIKNQGRNLFFNLPILQILHFPPKEFEIKDLGPMKNFLEMEVARSKKGIKKGILIS
ncbi:hypothetical protein CK203_054865 [Vitis vinifera]|uniref:Reverse transcriptase zinc-binding domain-containing protein n=1 Tax=Vitis vinifera TaxID=29760 RepID=A0A438GAZ9_VITVI|nr:hypothetical protein CK203_054865 [Vitis vinifera]